MRERPLEFLRELREARGPVARFRLGPFEAHQVTAPEDIKRVLVDHSANYDRDMRQFDVIGLALGESLLTTSGDFWLRQRRIAQPAFHRHRIAQLAAHMSQAAQELVNGWDRLGREHTLFDLAQAMREVTFQIIVRTMFATELKVNTSEVAAAIEEMTAYVDRNMTAAVRLPLAVPTPANRRFLRARRTIDSITRHLVARRHADGAEATDLLGFLMAARDDADQRLTDTQICDEVKTMLLAGHDTSANTLTWVFHLLGQAPEVMRQVVAEAREVLGDRPATMEDCGRLTLITKVIKESLRLYPPGWLIGRHTVADDVIGGYRVRAGSMMFVVPYVTHRIEAYWPDPLTFDPERFTPQQEERRPRHAYLPFGAGAHRCIGQAFAMLEMQLVVATIAQRYAVIAEPGQVAVPNPRITLSIKNGLAVRVKRHAG